MIECWTASTLRRIYPTSTPGLEQSHYLDLLRGERGSFQVAVRTGDHPQRVSASVKAPHGIKATVRLVGYVPMPHFNSQTPATEIEGHGHLPGLVPDPLLPETSVLAGPWETNSFWISLSVSPDAEPGNHQIEVEVTTASSESSRLAVTLRVQPVLLESRKDFPITHWLYADAIADWYRVSMFSEPFWHLLDPYLHNLVDHGQDTIYTPLFTPPLDGIKRPTQLLRVEQEGDNYRFDWEQVERWLDMVRRAGFQHIEWSHLFSQWGAEFALRIYHGNGETRERLWPASTSATSPTYRNFLSAFLPEFERFLRSHGLLEQSFFHLSDEPHDEAHLANYRRARELIAELAPWMRVMDALSEVSYAREGLVDTPVALLPYVPDFLAEGFQPWSYFCGQPRGRYLNRHFDTPLAKIRMSGWLFYRTGIRGFLHWSVNYWYRSQTTELIDPFKVTDAAIWPDWAYGDPFVVYPGPDGPIDSIRWEVFAESLQDFSLLQTASVERTDPLLDEIRDFAEFPRTPEWITSTRSAIIERINKK